MSTTSSLLSHAIEHFTGLDFLTALPNEEEVEKATATELWESGLG